MAEQKRVRMLVAMAGEGFSWGVDEVVLVDEGLAVALCTEPVDGPRAAPVDWEISAEATAKATEAQRRQTATQPRHRTRTART